MVGIEVVWTHYELGNERWIVVWVTTGEVSWSTVFHDDATKVENDGICELFRHSADSCQLLTGYANWSAGP